MTAYSFKSFALRDQQPGDRTPLITIQHGHPLNNDHRAPFSSGSTAARALLAHAQRQLADPARGAEYFNRLRGEFDRSTVNGQRVQQRLRARQNRAAAALANSDVELTAEQLQIVAEIAMVQARVAERLLPVVAVAGASADKVIDQVDTITREALRSATHLRTNEAVVDGVDPNEWQRDLMDKFASVEGNSRDDDAALVAEFAELVNRLEAELPLAVERDEPLWEIDEALDPAAVAAAADRISEAMGADFNPQDAVLVEEISEKARQAVYTSMSMDEREFAATKIALTPAQRIEVGMQIVNSTPPLIRLPEAELSQGRYDVRMATEEEARVMDALIRFAGETRNYPGPEVAFDRIEGMKEIAMPTGEQGRFTIALAVNNNPASIAHASSLLRASAADPSLRLLVHTDLPAVAEQLQAVRAEALVANGREASFAGSEDATRNLGGWTLPDNGADRFIGSDARDAAIFVANADQIMVYSNPINLEIGSMQDAVITLGRAQSALRTTEADLGRAIKAVEASRNPELVAAAEALAAEGKDNRAALKKADASADKKLIAEVARREAAVKEASAAVSHADRRVQTMQRQVDQDAYRASSPGDIARATIVDLAQQQGKLHKVFTPGGTEQGVAVQTEHGPLVEVRNYVAQQKAQRLRNGDVNERGNLRRLFHSERGVNAILVDGSNFFREDKGAKAGMETMRNRIADLPKTATILTGNNAKNPITAELAEKSGRPVIHATAWRVSEHSKAQMDGRTVNLSDRKTELDLGLAALNGGKEARPRNWVYKDLKGALVVVHGGGSMNRDTYNAIQELAIQRGLAGHSLDNKDVMDAYNHLVANGHPHLEAPKIAGPQLARAIMQEALVDYANQAILATDMGKDFHSANLIRQAVDTDKLAAVIDKDGKAVPIATAYEHSLQFAPSIADNTRTSLGETMNVPTNSEYGQLVLSSLPGVSSARAAQMAEVYGTLGDVMSAAEHGEASFALPKALHHDLGRPNVWAAAVERTDNIEKAVDRVQMDAIAPTNDAYPASLRDAGRNDMLYTMGEVDLNTPTLALVVGGNSRPTDADKDAVRTLAAEANSKGWAVSLHLSGEASAELAKTISEMPEGERPRVLLVGDGFPDVNNLKVRDAVIAVGNAGGGYLTATAPVRHDREDGGEPTYLADRRAALEIQGRQASGMVVVKSTGNDIEMLALRAGMRAGRPVAAFGPSDIKEPTVDDLRYRSNAYSANRRLLAGGDRVSVMLESRHLAFQPNFIPDMTAQTEQRYIPFEGSTAGRQDIQDNNRADMIDRSAVETGSRMRTEVAWADRAEYIADGRGTADFIAKIEAGEARQIEAKEVDLARMSREKDNKFLDTASRSDVRADVREVFQEMADRSHDDITADTAQHFLQQRSGVGR